MFVEIKSKADYQRVVPYFYTEINDTLTQEDLSSLSKTDSNIFIFLNDFDKRKYVNFFAVSTYPDISDKSIDSSITNFEKAILNYEYVYFESNNYTIKISLPVKLDHPQTIEGNIKSGIILPEFYFENDRLRYRSVESKIRNLLIRF